VEAGPSKVLSSGAIHPYTKLLLDAMPGVRQRGAQAVSDTGEAPSLIHLPAGCAFYSRCARHGEQCSRGVPPLAETQNGHFVACFQENG
jgi:oligopeptide/dipeptide ABC transporter ATP-binding protein